jgi:hypothetical protein
MELLCAFCWVCVYFGADISAKGLRSFILTGRKSIKISSLGSIANVYTLCNDPQEEEIVLSNTWALINML